MLYVQRHLKVILKKIKTIKKPTAYYMRHAIIFKKKNPAILIEKMRRVQWLWLPCDPGVLGKNAFR